MDLKAMFKLSYGVFLVSTSYKEKDNGCIVNSFAQVTNEPIQVTVTINKNNLTKQLIEQTQTFHVTALTVNTSMELIGRFGFKSGRDIEKFAEVEMARDHKGNAYVKGEGCADYVCEVIDQIDLGTHVMFIAKVVDASITSDEEVMTYAYYHKVKNGVTPPNATTYQKETQKTGWRCKICGYVYEGDELPEDYVCPLCKASASEFEKI